MSWCNQMKSYVLLIYYFLNNLKTSSKILPSSSEVNSTHSSSWSTSLVHCIHQSHAKILLAHLNEIPNSWSATLYFGQFKMMPQGPAPALTRRDQSLSFCTSFALAVAVRTDGMQLCLLAGGARVPHITEGRLPNAQLLRDPHWWPCTTAARFKKCGEQLLSILPQNLPPGWEMRCSAHRKECGYCMGRERE